MTICWLLTGWEQWRTKQLFIIENIQPAQNNDWFREDMPSWNVPRVECNKKQQLLKRSKIFEYSAFRFLTSRRKFNKKQQWSTQKLPWPGSYGVVLGSHAATNHVHSQVTNFWLTSYNPELGELLARSPICWVACIREEYGKVEGWEAEGTENSVKDKDSCW